MRRLLALGLLAAFILAVVAAPHHTRRSASGGRVADRPAQGKFGASVPTDDGAYWRQAQAVQAAVAASPWRVQELHAHLATQSVFVEFATVSTAVESVDRPGRPHGPPQSLNDPLRI